MPVYCAKTDVNNVYGEDNINKWADLNNNGIDSEINSRVTWALELAYTELNSMLFLGPYVVPFAVAPSSPPEIVDMASRWTGWLLYESRGITDNADPENNQLARHRDNVTKNVAMIHSGQKKIVGLDRTKAYPEAYP